MVEKLKTEIAMVIFNCFPGHWLEQKFTVRQSSKTIVTEREGKTGLLGTEIFCIMEGRV